MDVSVLRGGALVLLGIVCVIVQLRWAASDRRKEQEAAERAAEEEGDEAPPPEPDPWERLPIQDRF